MAWLDDRAWCHPKFVGLSDKAFRAHVNGICYSAGMGTKGVLSPAQQRLVGGTKRVKQELEDAGLWDPDGTSVQIHNWREHNEKRDQRKTADRERKRRERQADPHGWVSRTAEWSRTRRSLFQRDRGVCVDCGKQDDRWHADHVVKRSVLLETGGDPFDISNIVTRCPSCHGRRHARERLLPVASDTGNDIGSDRRALTGERLKSEETTTTNGFFGDAGWNDTQRREALTDEPRARAWVKYAMSDSRVENVAAFSYSGFKGGQWPPKPKASPKGLELRECCGTMQATPHAEGCSFIAAENDRHGALA